jgi:spore maturation protein A
VDLIFYILIIGGIIVAAINGRIDVVTNSLVSSANSAVERVLGLVGIMTLWLGMARIAEESGLLEAMTRLIQPLIKLLFPSIPKGHPAMGSILMNICANMMGFGSAATPFGLKAMKELQKINDDKETASDAMCTFLAINTSSVTLVPATLIAMRAAAGSNNPTEIVGTTLFATTCSTLVAITLDSIFRRRNREKNKKR